MKKSFLFPFILFSFLLSLNAAENLEAQMAAAINKSDVPAVKALLKNISKSSLDNIFQAAIYTCNPSRTEEDVICNKENNKQILVMLIEAGANPDKISVETKCPVKNCGLWKVFSVKTYLSLLQDFNPTALPAVLPYTDKCLVAITQIQAVSPKSKNFNSYVNFWRDNECNLKKFKVKPSPLNDEEDTKHALEIGLSKNKIKDKYGEPTIYEHPSEDTEVLTYKNAEKEDINYSVEGLKGKGKSIYTNEVAFIYTLMRGVVTGVEFKEISSTRAGGETQKNDFERLQKITASPSKSKRRSR